MPNILVIFIIISKLIISHCEYIYADELKLQ